MNSYEYEKFSVLMSVYKNEKEDHFREALKSILINQTILPDEFVLVVDGPITEALELVIDEFKKIFVGKFIIYRLKDNMGLGIALNYGLNYCTNNIVARADSDDICLKDRFRIQLEEMYKDSSIDICGGYIEEFNNSISEPVSIKKLPLNNSDISNIAKFRNPINHMTVMFKKDKILQIGSYEDVPYVEDYYLWVKAINNNLVIKNIDKILVYVRIGNGMIARRGNKSQIGSFKKLYTYMLNNDMIGRGIYIRNMATRYLFVYSPNIVRKVCYRFFLREKI